MRPLSARRLKRGLPLAIAATAALAVPGSAGAALQAGAPAYSPLSGPVPVSGSIDQALSQGKVCYDRQIKTNTTDIYPGNDASPLTSEAFAAVQPDGTTNLFGPLGLDFANNLLNGIGAGGSLLGAPNSVRVSANPADGGKCVILGFDPATYLGGTTLLTAGPHAVEDFSNEPSLPGSVTASGGDFAPASVPVLGGQTVGNLFTGVKSVDPNSNSVTLSLNQPATLAGADLTLGTYEIWFPGGRHIDSLANPTLSVDGKSITVTFPSLNADGPINVQQAIAITAWENAVDTKSIIANGPAQNPILSMLPGVSSLTGSPLATYGLQESASLAAPKSVRGMAQSVTRVGPKSWVFNYDQSDLSLRDANHPDAYALAVDGTQFWASSAQKLNDQQVIVNFAGITNPAEIVQVVDDGGLVGNQENLYGDAASIPTNFVVAANHNVGAGYTVGPDLTGAIKQPTTLANPDTSSVEATFDSALNLADVNPFNILLIERDGSLKAPIGLINAYNTNDNVGHVVLQYRKSFVDQSVGILVNNSGGLRLIGSDQTLSVDSLILCGGHAVSDLFGNLNSEGSSGFVTPTTPQQPSTPPSNPTTSQSTPSISAPSLAPATVQTIIAKAVKKAAKKKAVKKHVKKHKKARKHTKKRRRAAVTGRRR